MRKSTVKISPYKHVLHELGRSIVSGEVRPGDVLPRESVLAKELRVSRGVLREAIKVLSAKGMIESCSGIGARVHEERYWAQLDADVLAWRCTFGPTDDFIDKVMEMRRIIEPAVAAATAQRRSEKQRAAIHDACRAMAVAHTRDRWAEAELTFYEAVLQATGNEFMCSLFSVVEAAVNASFTLCVCDVDNFNIALPHYQKAAQAISDSHSEKASDAMLTIIDHEHDRLRRNRRARAGRVE
jgi:DNA-binding FadR family transcriptional regulator